jgi:uncharacterized protein (DUF1800 family)
MKDGRDMSSAQLNPPDDAFEAYTPTAAEPWNVRRAGHLLRRAGFGAGYQRLTDTLAQSPRQAIAQLFSFDPSVDPLNDVLDELQGYLTFKEIKPVQEWCFFRMLNNAHPLQEKLMLFWHNRFATSAGKVDYPPLMHSQMELFRQKGLGSFRDLLASVGHDPAMLVWLDGQYNHKGKPNENYGREVMELFTLGINSYGETDVKELARAFTGWSVQGTKAVFNKQNFDPGPKTIFGQTAAFDSETSVDLLLGRPQAAPHLARRLLIEFVHPHPLDSHVQHYAQRLIATKWDLKVVLTELFSSRLFFSDWAYRSRIKSPIELAVGAVTTLGGKVNTSFIREQTTKMGQAILMPPNVKGWDGGETWINANTVLLRFNFGEAMATQRLGEFAKKSQMETWLLQHNLKTSGDIVDHYTKLFLDGEIDDETRKTLIAYMDHGSKNEPRPFVLDKDVLNDKVRGLLHLLMAVPEYQLA